MDHPYEVTAAGFLTAPLQEAEQEGAHGGDKGQQPARRGSEIT